jgi:membrane protease YdiL (CAAX protease family)
VPSIIDAVIPRTRAVPELIATLAAMCIGLVAMMIVAAVIMPWDLRAGLLLGEVALVVPLAAAAASLEIPWRRLFALAEVPGITIALAFLCGGAFWLLSAGVVETQAAVWPLPPGVAEAFRHLHSALRPSGVLATLGSILALAIAPACAEELVFRGAVLGALQRVTGAAGAVAGSAVIFGLIHLQPAGYRIPFALILGVALGALRLRTHSVIPGMIAHGVLNTTTLLITPFIDDEAATPTAVPLTQALGLLALGALLAIGLVRAMRSVDSRQS